MKSYSAASTDVDATIESVRVEYHGDLAGATIAALFIFDLESTDPVLTHNGYPAQAVVRITPLRDRALGVADAVIVIDRSNWVALTRLQRDALIDHELMHLDRVTDKETGNQLCDAIDRPKLAIRRHDRQHGWFDEVARRHGEHSAEVRQARALISQTDQLYFDFGRLGGPKAPAGAPKGTH